MTGDVMAWRAASADSPRFQLKRATDDLHRQLDDSLSRLNLADAGDYRRFLSLHARVVLPVEAALAAGGPEDAREGWTAGRRAAALAADLAALGEAPGPALPVPPMSSTAERLGYAYVLEGSRLGGRILREQVPADAPSAYLDQSADLAPWRAFIAVADRLLYGPQQIGEAVSAARDCFALFILAAREAGVR